MSAIKGVFRNGQIVFDPPTDWPEGIEVRIEPALSEEMPGMREEDWPETPEAIANWLAWYASLEPLEFTPEEEAVIEACRRKTKDYTVAHMHEGIAGLFP